MSETTGPVVVDDEQDGAETRELELDELAAPEVDNEGNLVDPQHVSGNPEFVPQHVLDGGYDYRVPGNDASGYIGVDPSYQTYANPLNKPMLTDLERFELTDQYDHLIDNADELGYLHADKAVVDADEAQVLADEAKAVADKAQQDAEEAQARADELKKTAGQIPTTADEAQKMADKAQALADKMKADEDAKAEKEAADKKAAAEAFTVEDHSRDVTETNSSAAPVDATGFPAVEPTKSDAGQDDQLDVL